jgi:hypothetical protein
VTGGVDALNDAIAHVGPISVSIDAEPNSFYFYAGGYYYSAECKSGMNDLDHTVLAIGYTTYNGQIYTIVKNSWSTHWGDGGTHSLLRPSGVVALRLCGGPGIVYISQKDNCCGVATQPTYVLIE